MVYIVDDDPLTRASLEALLFDAELLVTSFATGHEFLRHPSAASEPCCLLLDLGLPDANGFELYEQLLRGGYLPPVIFITGNASVAMSVKAMKAGAFDFLLKPFDNRELLASVLQALEKDRLQKEFASALELLRERVEHLTDREFQVFQAVSEGLLNKQISARLNIVEQTVKVHRARMMRKLQANSIAAVVRIAEVLSRSQKPSRSASTSFVPPSNETSGFYGGSRFTYAFPAARKIA